MQNTSFRILKAAAMIVLGGMAAMGLSAQSGRTEPAPTQIRSADAPEASKVPLPMPNYILGPGDVISIRTPHMEEISDKPFVIDNEGYTNLPKLGRIKVMGLKVEQLETELIERLKTYVRAPQAVVTVVQYRADMIFLMGAFSKPGTYPYQPKRRLSEMLSIAGGTQMNADRRVKITRRVEYGSIPLPNAVRDPARGVWEVEVDLRQVIGNINSPEDIILQPFDVVQAATREKIYVSGEVRRPGAYELEDRESVSLTQLLSLAGGFTEEANLAKTVILRSVMETNRRAEIPLDVKKVMAGKANDFPLLPNDVLMVPKKKGGWSKTSKTAALIIVPSLLTSLIYVAIR